MSENASTASLPGEGGGLVPQSETAEGGEGLSGNPEVNAAPGTPADEAADEADPDAPFDPAEHNVDAVNEYLKTADDTEVERVLAAERQGKARSTVTGLHVTDTTVTNEDDSDQPVWDESTHGPIGDRKGYRVI